MQSNKDLFEDMAKMTSSAFGLLNEIRKEVKTALREQLKDFFEDGSMVSREEFETVKLMAAKAREEQAKLEKRLAVLEKGKKVPARPAAKTKARAGKKKSGK